MSHALPPQNSPLRSLFSVEHLVAIGTRQVSPPTFPQARISAREVFAADPAVRSVQSICLRADGHLALVQFGPRGGHKELWAFN